MAIINPTSAATLATIHNTDSVLTLLSPALTNSLYFAYILQRLLSTTTLFLLFRTYLLSLFLLQQSYSASQVIFVQSVYATSVLSKNSYWASKQGVKTLWKSTETLRKRLFYEFMVFILGGGHAAILLLVWPGWIFVAGGIWAASWLRV